LVKSKLRCYRIKKHLWTIGYFAAFIFSAISAISTAAMPDSMIWVVKSASILSAVGLAVLHFGIKNLWTAAETAADNMAALINQIQFDHLPLHEDVTRFDEINSTYVRQTTAATVDPSGASAKKE
jgi:hypothetical protein